MVSTFGWMLSNRKKKYQLIKVNQLVLQNYMLKEKTQFKIINSVLDY